METAGEGGAWGIALLGSYLVNNEKKQSLADFLDESVFVGDAGITGERNIVKFAIDFIHIYRYAQKLLIFFE